MNNDHLNRDRPSRRALRQGRREQRKQRRRKIQALATGGLILGFGATATLAAWTDKATGAGQFEAGEFALEIETGQGWESTTNLEFANAAMFPGQRVYAPVLLRSSTDTSVDGTVTVSGSNPEGELAPHLRFRVVSVDAVEPLSKVTCSAESFSGADAEFSSMGQASEPTSPQHLEAEQAQPIAYCFEVELDPQATDETQQLSAKYTWNFHAQSNVPE